MEVRSSPWHRLETCAVPLATAFSRRARCEIDLSPGSTAVPVSRADRPTVCLIEGL